MCICLFIHLDKPWYPGIASAIGSRLRVHRDAFKTKRVFSWRAIMPHYKTDKTRAEYKMDLCSVSPLAHFSLGLSNAAGITGSVWSRLIRQQQAVQIRWKSLTTSFSGCLSKQWCLSTCLCDNNTVSQRTMKNRANSCPDSEMSKWEDKIGPPCLQYFIREQIRVCWDILGKIYASVYYTGLHAISWDKLDEYVHR